MRLLAICSHGLCSCAKPCACTTEWGFQGSVESWSAGGCTHDTPSSDLGWTACGAEGVAEGAGLDKGAESATSPTLSGAPSQGSTNGRLYEWALQRGGGDRDSILYLHSDLCALLGALALSPSPDLLSQILLTCPHILRTLLAPLLCPSAPAFSQKKVLSCVCDLCASPEGCRALLDPLTEAPVALL